MKTLIIIDMQNDFITGSLGTKEAESIIPKVVEKIHAAETIAYTLDSHEYNYLDTQEGKFLPVKHCIINTPGWQLNTEIESAIFSRMDEGVIPREFMKSTFGSVNLAKDMKYWFEKISPEEEFKVELIGLCTDICVVSNALLLKAFVPEMEITVDANCCAGTTPEAHRAALSVMRSNHINIVNE